MVTSYLIYALSTTTSWAFLSTLAQVLLIRSLGDHSVHWFSDLIFLMILAVMLLLLLVSLCPLQLISSWFFGDIGFILPIFLNLNVGGDVTYGISNVDIQFEDIDGDGFVDFCSSSSSDDLSVQLSSIGYTNYLKKVSYFITLLQFNLKFVIYPVQWDILQKLSTRGSEILGICLIICMFRLSSPILMA